MITEVLTDEDIQDIVDEYEEDWEDLEPFSGECPYCGAEMEVIDHGTSVSGEAMARWMCPDCEEEKRLLGSTWVYDAGDSDGFIVPDRDLGR